MSKTSGDSKRGVVVGLGALAVVIVCAAAYYGSMTGSENAAGTVMQAKRYKADSTTGPTPTPTTADTQQAGQPTAGVANSNQGAGNSQGSAGQGVVVSSRATGNSQSGNLQGSNSQGSNSQGSNSQGSNSQGSSARSGNTTGNAPK